jgi:hypothetical protein
MKKRHFFEGFWKNQNRRFFDSRFFLLQRIGMVVVESPKKKGRWFWEGISNILNTRSTRFTGNVQRAERKLQQILFQNLKILSN